MQRPARGPVRLWSGCRTVGCRGMSGPREGSSKSGRKEAMVFQATKWSWKRIAARLLLIPVLAGGSAAIAHAQPKTAAGTTRAAPQTKTAAGAVMTAAPAGDPQAMLKEGRKALAEGRFNDAQDFARRAEASNASGKWGLFDDTPSALLKDVQAAVLKTPKAESEQLV